MSAALAAVIVLAAAVPPQAPPKTVSPVTVVPSGEAPKLAASFPAEGETVAAGVLVMKITFDQKMSREGFDITAAPGGQAPACLKRPRLLNDEKTFVLLCTTAPGARYALAFNGSGKGGFMNLGEARAAPATLAFATSSTLGPTDLAAAMKLEKLSEADMPIERSDVPTPAGRAP